MATLNYNPDVLSCLANLSNDEVFTPPTVVNRMLDMLPSELWSNPDATFLDPVSKTGVFLREIAKRLMEGLKEQIPDVQVRANHIFTKQLYGIAITELTSLLSRRSLYCSKVANGKYSVCTEFADEQGNLRYTPMKHVWENGRCRFCGASQEVYEKDREGLETHAYQFIHTVHPEKIFNMRFDVIIGNPPYQLSDGGFGISASPIYQYFVEQAMKLKPRFLTMIIPARWYAGGKGLDDFRDVMLRDDRLREIHDYPEAIDCFPGVQIKGGICFFLWNRDVRGKCKVFTHRSDAVTSMMERNLLEKDCDTFIRYNEAISILHKVRAFEENTINVQISSRKPFGLATTFRGHKIKDEQHDIAVFQNGGIGYVNVKEVEKNEHWISEYKVLVPRAGSGSDAFPHSILGVPFVVNPLSVCSETYIVAGIYKNRVQAENLVTYIKTRFFRFMVLLKKNTQDAPARVYSFVPLQDFSEPWTDEKLYKKYGLTDEEIAFIESMIRPME